MDKRIIVILVLFLTACQIGTGQETTHHTGQKGVDISFAGDSPPGRIYEDRTFPVSVTLHNRGTEDISSDFYRGVVWLNYDDYYMSLEKKENLLFELRGKSDLYPNGEVKQKRVSEMKALPLKGETESPETQILAYVCYPYNTTLNADICIDSQRERNEREQVCESRDHSYSKGQGAPVSITKVEVDMYPAGNYIRPRFVIHVKNTGEGSVLKPAQLTDTNLRELCTVRGETSDMNAISISANIADVELQCEPNPARLLGSSNKIFCDVPKESLEENARLFRQKDNFVSTLTVNLEYLYTSATSKTVEIRRRNPQGGETTPGSVGGCRAYEQAVNGECVPKCRSERPGYSCSCDEDTCIEEGKDRCVFSGEDLCGPGRYCCNTKSCSEIEGGDACQAAGCTYNGTTCKEVA